jgi:hypothetical protein
MSITTCIPVPLRLTLGGKDYLVSPLRIRDLAELTGWAEARSPEPLELLAGIDRESDPERWRSAFRDAYELAEAGPQTYVASGPEALVALIRVAIGRHRPDFTEADALEVFGACSLVEFQRLTRFCWCVDPLDVLERAFEPPDGPAGKPMSWEQAIDELSRARGWTYETIAEMSLAAFHHAMRCGNPKDRGSVPRRGESVIVCARRRRRAFYGEDGASG